ncbi:hypothetical protein LIER_28686 [Lithospermum erythrorhizon]|uniref:Uncharacterized protein n=1 Tax=Lithospermum erythrorhizon TaxID=34254 RepID=A0AAV3RKT1_LITER
MRDSPTCVFTAPLERTWLEFKLREETSPTRPVEWEHGELDENGEVVVQPPLQQNWEGVGLDRSPVIGEGPGFGETKLDELDRPTLNPDETGARFPLGDPQSKGPQPNGLAPGQLIGPDQSNRPSLVGGSDSLDVTLNMFKFRSTSRLTNKGKSSTMKVQSKKRHHPYQALTHLSPSKKPTISSSSLAELVNSNKPNLVFLIETKLRKQEWETVIKKVKLLLEVEADGRKGGLAS